MSRFSINNLSFSWNSLGKIAAVKLKYFMFLIILIATNPRPKHLLIHCDVAINQAKMQKKKVFSTVKLDLKYWFQSVNFLGCSCSCISKWTTEPDKHAKHTMFSWLVLLGWYQLLPGWYWLFILSSHLLAI